MLNRLTPQLSCTIVDTAVASWQLMHRVLAGISIGSRRPAMYHRTLLLVINVASWQLQIPSLGANSRKLSARVGQSGGVGLDSHGRTKLCNEGDE